MQLIYIAWPCCSLWYLVSQHDISFNRHHLSPFSVFLFVSQSIFLFWSTSCLASVVTLISKNLEFSFIKAWHTSTGTHWMHWGHWQRKEQKANRERKRRRRQEERKFHISWSQIQQVMISNLPCRQSSFEVQCICTPHTACVCLTEKSVYYVSPPMNMTKCEFNCNKEFKNW